MSTEKSRKKETDSGSDDSTVKDLGAEPVDDQHAGDVKGGVTPSDFSFVKKMDKSSPILG